MSKRLTLLVCLIYVPAFAQDTDQIQRSQEFRRTGDYKQAENILRKALAGSPEQHTRIAALIDLADLMREQDRKVESEKLFNEALNSPGITWQQTFASTLGLADVHRQEQNWRKSMEEDAAAATLARTHNEELLAAFADRSLGEAWLDQGNISRAEPLLRRALSIIDRNPDVPRERVALALDSMASLYRSENKNALAEEALMRELEIHRSVLGEHHPQTAMVMGRLAELWSMEGDIDKARSWSQQSLEMMKSSFGERSVPAGSAMVTVGLIEQRASHLESAAEMYSKALAIFSEVSVSRTSIRTVAQLYAGVLSQLHKGREAKQVVASFLSK